MSQPHKEVISKQCGKAKAHTDIMKSFSVIHDICVFFSVPAVRAKKKECSESLTNTRAPVTESLLLYKNKPFSTKKCKNEHFFKKIYSVFELKCDIIVYG